MVAGNGGHPLDDPDHCDDDRLFVPCGGSLVIGTRKFEIRGEACTVAPDGEVYSDGHYCGRTWFEDIYGGRWWIERPSSCFGLQWFTKCEDGLWQLIKVTGGEPSV